jgi:hypothetical protein
MLPVYLLFLEVAWRELAKRMLSESRALIAHMSRRKALLALAVGLLATGGGVATASARTGSERAQVRQMLAPIKALDRAVMTNLVELVDIGERWASEVTPCVQGAYAEVARLRGAATITENEAWTIAWIVFGVAEADAAVELSVPLDADLAKAQHAYEQMRPRDKVLRAGARGKARELAAFRSIEEIDTCAFAHEWGSNGFSFADPPQLAPGVEIYDDLAGPSATLAVHRATKRLRRFGASRTQAESFEFFPTWTLAEPAYRNELLPPE